MHEADYALQPWEMHAKEWRALAEQVAQPLVSNFTSNGRWGSTTTPKEQHSSRATSAKPSRYFSRRIGTALHHRRTRVGGCSRR